MTERIMIPETEYAQRVARAAELTAEAGLDVLVANSNEADYANVRYLSAYWPLFEMGGVAIAPSGQAALLIGPESEEYAKGRSTLSNIHLMTEYRESEAEAEELRKKTMIERAEAEVEAELEAREQLKKEMEEEKKAYEKAKERYDREKRERSDK